jgi:hypothetical protein
MMNYCRSEKRQATRCFSVRQGNEHGICVAVRLPIPPYRPIRKGCAPVTPLKGGRAHAKQNRRN